ncbi:hypothetical protein BSL78_23653 [Apostichopus japonicus]|uniref:Uncharacterized protein n=1 Tax=Stichopus japonicus TaxID=307972 RepID=A0A2G8JUW6_STIJA|nr:hypothetical protein BSL78_23653 [Apostichopus japonicus]
MGNCHPRRTRGASGIVATVLGRFGAVKATKMCSYAQAPGVLNGHRQVRIDLSRTFPPSCLLQGIKLTCAIPVSPAPASGVERPGTKPRAAQTKSVGAAFVLGMMPLLAQAKLCAHSVGRRDMFFALVPPLMFYDKDRGQEKSQVLTHLLPRRKLHARRGNRVRIHLPHLVHPPRSCRPNPVPAPRKSPPASPSTRPVPSPVRRRYRQIRRLCPTATPGLGSSGLRRLCLTATPETR